MRISDWRSDVCSSDLGYVEIAKKLAPALTHMLEEDGIVVGIEGVWGSGKTTLVNYLLDEIQLQGEDEIDVIRLSPWLSGDGETLVGALLRAMAASIESRQVVGRWVRACGRSEERRVGKGCVSSCRVRGARVH